MIVSILGCGWLGLPLAHHFVNEGLEVKGSTTTPEKLTTLKQIGVEPYLIRLPDDLHRADTDAFWEGDVLFLNIPPSRSEKNVLKAYPHLIEKVISRAKKGGIKRVIFAGSTSVYSDTGGITGEDDAEKGNASRPSGEALLVAEDVILNSGLEYIILRLGGLYGYDRHPVKYLAGRTGLKDPLKPVNLVHQTDCVLVIHEIIRQNKKNEIYNVVSDGHPPRGEFYTSAARHFDLPLPEFEKPKRKKYSVISNFKLKKDLGFSFSYPNPLDHTP